MAMARPYAGLMQWLAGAQWELLGLKALAKAHERDGKLPWSRLFEEAITLAEQGFKVSPRLHKLLARRINPEWRKCLRRGRILSRWCALGHWHR